MKPAVAWAIVAGAGVVCAGALGVLALLPGSQRGQFIAAAAPTVVAGAGAVWNYLHSRTTLAEARGARKAATTAVEQTNGTLDARITTAVVQGLAHAEGDGHGPAA